MILIGSTSTPCVNGPLFLSSVKRSGVYPTEQSYVENLAIGDSGVQLRSEQGD